jgi:hypothetical protein
MAAFAEADVQAIQGSGSSQNTTSSIRNRESRRMKCESHWVRILPYYYVEVRPQYRINMETPSVKNDQPVVQMHVWFKDGYEDETAQKPHLPGGDSRRPAGHGAHRRHPAAQGRSGPTQQ